MWDLIYYAVFAAASIYCWDFSVNTKSYHGEDAVTDLSRVKTLYKNIKAIKTSTKRDASNEVVIGYDLSYDNLWKVYDCLRLNIQVGFETCKTLAKYKYHKAMTQYYSPERLGNDLLVIPYYVSGRWHKALVKHVSRTPRVLKIMSYNPDGQYPNGKDVTNEIREYIGPNEDFYCQAVSPSMFGYGTLTFTMLTNGKVSTQSVAPFETIDLSAY
jgi:hypothetical protein